MGYTCTFGSELSGEAFSQENLEGCLALYYSNRKESRGLFAWLQYSSFP